MKVPEARTLVKEIREGKALDASPWWQGPTQDARITVAVVDNGCQIDHPAFPRPAETYSFARRAGPKGASAAEMLNNAHGTQSAGLVVGSESSDDTFLGGVAAGIDGLDFWPVRYSDGADADADVTMHTRLVTDGAQVITNSYGLQYTHSRERSKFMGLMADLPTATFLFAAGNDNAALGSLDHFKDVILVAASMPADRAADETKVPASNYGKGVTICAPGGASDAGGPISTTNGSTYEGFSDTSAACPMVAGVVCLMLLANPTLTPAQIKEHLYLSADKIDPTSGTWATKPTGFTRGQLAALPESVRDYRYSEHYGFGRVNALAAVRRAIA